MRFANITERLTGLGSEKWAVHIEGKRRAALGEQMIFLSIGEPDAPPPAAILDEANKQMRAGRTRYAEGRGEASTRRSLARLYTRQTGRTINENQFIYLPGTQTALFAAMMMSQPSMSSNPPASATPRTEAITGCGSRSKPSITSRSALRNPR